MPLVMIKSDPRAREKPCLRCGYSLRKLVDAKYCPECGLSVWLSLNNNDSLDWSNPPWLGRIAWGAWIMGGAQILGLLAFAVRFIPVGRIEQRMALTAVVAGAYLAVYHAGLLVLVMHEGRYPDRLKAVRLASRIVAGAAMLLGAGLMVRGFSRVGAGWPGADEVPLWLIGLEGVVLASALCTWAYLRVLARRAPSSTLARICGYLLLAPLLSLFKAAPWLGIYVAVEFAWVVSYLPWVYLPCTAGLLGYFGVLFRKASAAAEVSWAAETNPGGGVKG